MSEAALQKQLGENEQLKREVELTADIIKVSEACQSLKDFTEEKKDPLIPEKADPSVPNTWTEKANGVCVLL